ncbi:MAG: glycerol kinase GlpK [Lachnospiraceae bacterium]|nr:glycerol kinase GlpK [Lachnospiraceae bacterium]
MKQKYMIALDQGTTSSRCILFDHSGKICSMAQKEFPQIYPKPGWVEHDPIDIWASQLSVMTEAMSKLGVSGEDIAGIGITNQRETTIVWDRITGEPVYHAIVWQCRRTADYIDRLAEGKFDRIIREKTGLVPDAYFSATKIAWILDNVPGAREKADRRELLFGTVDTWLIWKLTEGQVHVTDYTNASRTMLFDIHKLCWDPEILEYFQIPESMLPKVMPSSTIYGYTQTSLVGAPIPIAGAAGDQQAALFGQCCFKAGEMKNTYGTGCFLLMNTGKEPVTSENGLLTTIAASSDGQARYALEGSVFVAGAVIQWLRDEMGLIQSAAQSQECCEAVEDTAGVYVVPAFTGLGAPYWDQRARGIITGLTRGAGRNHIVRAAVESMAYQVNDLIEVMKKDAGIKDISLKVDGGAAVNDFLLQFQSDILNTSVDRPVCIETTALGAAFLAGLAVGFWTDEEEIRKNWVLSRKFEPSMTQEKRDSLLEGWRDAVSRCQ